MQNDKPYSLQNSIERRRRNKLAVKSKHIRPILPLIELIKAEKCQAVPLPDPLDGGVFARILFLMERPGPQAKESGFISRNNPDPTARNIFNFLREARIPRKAVLLWNIIPWFGRVGGSFIRSEDLAAGTRYAISLIKLMSKLEGIVFCGHRARAAKTALSCVGHRSRVLKNYFIFHPSPRSAFGGKMPKAAEIKKTLRRISSDFQFP